MPISDVLDRLHVTGSALGPVNAPPEWLRVSDYAIEGAADDSAAITATIAAVVAQGGGTVLLGPQTYDLGTTTIVVPNTVNLIGTGYGTVLTYAGTGSAVRLSGAQFATVGQFGVVTSHDAGSAIEAGTATRQSILTGIASVGTNTALTTGAGFSLNAIAGFSGGLVIHNCNVTGYKYGVKFTSVNTSTDTWTAVDITSLWAVGRAAGIVAGSAGIYFDANTNGIGTKWRGGTIEAFALGVQHVNGGFGGDIECDLEGNTADVSVGASFTGRIAAAVAGSVTVYGGPVIIKSQIAIGATPAHVGGLRLSNSGGGASGQVYGRNGLDSADIPMLELFSDNHLYMGAGGTALVGGGTSNSQDLGLTGARWRTGYFGTSVQIPKAVGVVFVGTSFNLSVSATEPAAAQTLTLPLIRQAETVAIKPQTYTTLSTPKNPTGTADTTGKMMGLAGAITPAVTGNIRVSICGCVANGTIADGGKVQIRVGTGTAPSNADALTGTAYGSLQEITGDLAGANKNPFHVSALITGLTVGTAVWIDVGLAAVTGGTATISSVAIDAFEL